MFHKVKQHDQLNVYNSNNYKKRSLIDKWGI